MSNHTSRREFIRGLGVSAAAANFLFALPSLGWAASAAGKKRVVFLFSPNGVIPKHFWPDSDGEHGELKRILAPLEPFKSSLLTLQGVDNKIKGDGDGHMRGIGCLLTGVELFPGDVQGGSDTPAGWSMGISLDQAPAHRIRVIRNESGLPGRPAICFSGAGRARCPSTSRPAGRWASRSTST